VRALKIEIAELRARVRELEHEVDDLKERRR
jgi:cell division protein FtsB